MILLVSVRDRNGRPLRQISGPVIPDWCGSRDKTTGENGKSEDRDYGGLPGKAFAKVLQEEWTHDYPSGSYWNPVSIKSDNRIPAFEKDVSRYRFATKSGQRGPVTVRIKLLYRRAFIKLQRQKGWTDPDILMEHSTHLLPIKSE
jgi:hypothetical protein